MDNIDKSDAWGCGICIAIVLLFIGFFATSAIVNLNRPEHKVKVEYVIYRGGKPYHKSGVYTMKGDDFKARIYTEKQRYGHGPNVFLVQDGHAFWNYWGKQSVCIYTGYNDVECKSIEIID